MKKYRRCPHCGGKTGFVVTSYLSGHEDIKINFAGKIIDVERNGIDELEKNAECMDCKKLISISRLDTTAL